MRQFPPPPSLNAMREAGRLVTDKAVFEVDLMTGNFTWANEFATQKLGMRLDQLTSLSAFDLVPAEFHDQVRDTIADRKSGRTRQFSVWPSKSAGGKLIWWYVFRSQVDGTLGWSFAEFIQETATDGAAYIFMRVTMMNANSYGVLHARVHELDEWIRDQVVRLDAKDVSLEKSISDLGEKMKHVQNAATHAASASLEAATAVREMKDDVKDQLEKYEEEILKLISTDVYHDKRMEAFEKHVKETTSVAIQSITNQANKAGKGLSRKVTIPVSAIAAIATILQWIIQHWPQK